MTPLLCYISGTFAYFTTQSLEKQWGDDWNDAPYDCNAGSPYGPGDKDDPKWEIVKVGFESRLCEPSEYSQSLSVQDINRKLVPWLADRWGNSGVTVFAGATIDEFKAAVRQTEGVIYEATKK